MMFSLNEELRYIQATAAEVTAVYRSAEPVTLAPEGKGRQPCSAFLGVSQHGGMEQVQVALRLCNSRENLVYTASPSASRPGPHVMVDEGRDFLEKMGFRMEECNLGGSAVLRAMVIENMKIFRAGAQGEKAAPTLPAEPPELSAPPETDTDVETACTAPGSDLAALQAELQQLRRQSEVLVAENAALQRELAEAKSELAGAQAGLESVTAQNELISLQEEYEALRSEYALINEELSVRNAELLQLRGDLEAEPESERPSGLETDRTELLSSEEFVPAEAASPPQEEPRRHSSFADLEISPAAAQESTDFRLVHSLSAIPCTSPEQLIELRVSFNVVRIGIDDNPQQCSAYICGVERNGVKEVYVALHQIEEKKNLVYAPARQPLNAADYERVIRDAISFTDVTGFIINLANIGRSAQERARMMQQTPVFVPA